jgi:hypothetical protein
MFSLQHGNCFLQLKYIYHSQVDFLLTILSGSVLTTVWRPTGCRWILWPPDMEGNCEYVA